MDDREDQVRPQQQGPALAEAVFENGTAAVEMVPDFSVGQGDGRALLEGVTAKHVQGTAQPAGDRVVAGFDFQPAIRQRVPVLDAKHLIQSGSAAQSEQRTATIDPSGERLALLNREWQVPCQHHDARWPMEQFL